MYNISMVSKRVQKEFNEFNEEDKKRILDAFEILIENPWPLQLGFSSVNRCSTVKRIKVQRIRIFYKIIDSDIYIGKIENRNSQCYEKQIHKWFDAC
ncbi:type II toxin-antitoxin system RelE family toxin [Paenibacillus tepidiphilus]|uniref:type II toxin-antitoxin system RelE family toxin n=1 Tax=Paenibacillus tepidiphilus TaxID=2608683 RepID=UPI00123AC271|nr:hypothetical protein [Paenibacillus tepidiphilus]